MKIGIATVHTPPVRGGAEMLADGLADALRAGGHSLHRLVMPFSYDGVAAAQRAMEAWAAQDFEAYGGGGIDRMVVLKFPCHHLRHADAVAWLLHGHRPAYDLFGTPYGLDAADGAARALRDRIRDADRAGFGRLRAVYTISERVSERLLADNGVPSVPLLHPPADVALFRTAPAQPFVLAPSRLEALKRQDLLLRALARSRTDAVAVVVGEGGRRAALEALAAELGIAGRVRFLGAVSRRHLVELYAHAAAVFFGPLDEDYGYVTLEAMLAAKPVVTCTDSGGPLAFVRDGVTGRVVPPEPDAVADALDGLWAAPERAAALGRAGRELYEALDLSWATVAERLAAPHPAASAAAA